MLESLFNKIGDLNVCNFIKKRLQRWWFLVKLPNFLRTLFYWTASVATSWGLTRIFKGVQNKNRATVSNKVPYSAAKKYLLPQKFRSSHRQVLPCKFCEIYNNIFSYRTPPVAASFLAQTWYFYHKKFVTLLS